MARSMVKSLLFGPARNGVLTPCLLALTGTLALSACSKQPDASATPSAVPSTQEELQQVPAASSEAPASPASEAKADDSVADGPAPADIPEAVRGRWGLVRADCTSTRGDAKGLLEISARQLKFYESVAQLGTIKEAGESRIRATFAYTGEGQSWTQDVVLDVRGDGKTLIRRDYGKDAMPGPLTYTRCT